LTGSRDVAVSTISARPVPWDAATEKFSFFRDSRCELEKSVEVRMLPTIIDIEASGFGRRSYPIEVGLAMPDENSHCFMISPPDHWTFWDKEAEAVHGINRELLQEHGWEPVDVGNRLNQPLAGQRVYSDAWSHDISWLGKLFELIQVPQLFQLDSLRTLMSEEQVIHWHPTKDTVIGELNLNRHRASSDARIIQETFKRTRTLVDLKSVI